MKLRMGFVSNSSSSSFWIPKMFLSKVQIDALMKYWENRKSADGWSIKEVEMELRNEEKINVISGFTPMDNDDMLDFMEEMGLNEIFVHYEESDYR